MEMKAERFHLHNSLYPDKWSAGIYVRLSDEDRDKKRKTDLSQSIQNQTDFCRSYIEYLNSQPDEEFTLAEYKIYCDDDCTGMNFNRSGFQEMMRDVQANVIDCIIIKNLSRLGRYDTEMQIYLEKEFEQRGREVRLIAIGDNYDSLYKETNIEYRIRLMLNREYSETQHKNVSIAMHSMQKKGFFVGAFAPYGYQKNPENKHHLIVDPTAAVVVREIFDKYLLGNSPKEIAADLTREGIVNPATYKRLHGSNFRCSKKISDEEVHWRSDGVKKILMDETYTGTLVQHKQVKQKLTDDKPTRVEKDQWIRCEGTHEAVISKEEWITAQSMMKEVKRDIAKKDEVTIFKGILKCGDCRHAMRKRWDSYKQQKTGEMVKYLYYNCATFRDYSQHKKQLGENAPKCTSHYVSDKLLRGIVIDDLNKIIRQVENLRELAEKHQQTQKQEFPGVLREIENKNRRIFQYKERLTRARTLLYDGTISKEEYESDKAAIQADISSLDNEIKMLQKTIFKVSDVLSNPWVERLLENGAITELDRATVAEFIDKIYVFEDKHIEIVYKFSGEFDELFVKSV